MEYRILKKKEYNLIAIIHLQVFKDFFLTSLGENFLKTYYKACLESEESIAIGAVNNQNQLIGFSIGCKQSKGYHKRLIKRNLFRFLIQGIIILISKPLAIIRLLKNLDKNSNNSDDGNYAELLSIAVSKNSKGTGIGKEMILKFEEEARNRGCQKIALTTDYNNNEDVLEFYKKTGYTIFYEFTTYPNRKMYKLIKKL